MARSRRFYHTVARMILDPSDPDDPGGGYVSAEGSPIPPNQTIGNDNTPFLSRKRAKIESAVPPSKKSDSPSDSIQTTFTHPDFEKVKSAYSKDDVGPFIINVQREESDPASGIAFRAINFGHFLFKNKILGIVKDGVKKIGRNRFSVEFDTAEHANDFLSHSALASAKYGAIIPSFLVTRMGIIRDISTEWSMEEVVQNVSVPSGFGRVIKARRLSRKSYGENNAPIWSPTRSVVLTFSGRVLPPRVFCFYSSLPVECYLLPTIQCNNCCRFGHVKAQCRSKPRCLKCSQDHSSESCSSSLLSCLFCSGSHCANDKSCPEQQRQRNIKLIMSQENLSYTDSSARFPRVKKSFSATASSPSPPPTQYTPLPSQCQSPHSPHSYRKTVFSSPKPHVSSPNTGYDRMAHQNIVRVPTSSQPNGCALSQDSSSPDDNLIELLLTTLINILSRFSDTGLPNNMRQKLTELLSLTSLQNGPSSPSVELS